MVSTQPWTPLDLIVVSMARLLRDGEVVFHGVNSILPMVAVALARRLHAPRLQAINIAGGVNPTPRFLPRSTTDAELARGSAAILSNEDFYDLCMRGGVDTIFLGAVQVDGAGRTNLSRIGSGDLPRVRLPGGGGAPVLMPTAGRVIISRTEHSRRSFVERLDFVTAAGNVDRVVTPLCIFRRVDGRLEVESVHPPSSPEEVVERTGFALTIPGNCPQTPPPSEAELRALAELDPENVRGLEAR
ncbi:MAG: 3-oxoadipate--succinyl-CoA transferase [Chloroflexota bacterium]|nr:3-oxoadipate--succinyl-CoA transferase [Chloroflexota bacterium]